MQSTHREKGNLPTLVEPVNKWGWVQTLGVSLPFIAGVITVTLYVAGVKADAQTTSISQQKDIDSLKSAVADIPKIKEDISTIKSGVASTNQLIHDLSEYRFQYDPRQSDAKVKQEQTLPVASVSSTTSN